jgi:hypothetical protein
MTSSVILEFLQEIGHSVRDTLSDAEYSRTLLGERITQNENPVLPAGPVPSAIPQNLPHL